MAERRQEPWHFRAAKEFATRGGSKTEYYTVDRDNSVAQNRSHPGFAVRFTSRGGPHALIDVLKTKKTVSGHMNVLEARTGNTVRIEPRGGVAISANVNLISEPRIFRVIKAVHALLEKHAPK